MELTEALLIAGFVLAFGLVSRRLQTGFVTPPMAFVGFGLLVGPDALGWLDLDLDGAIVHLLTEITLVLVLFGDAARIDVRALRRELGLPVRMLLVGLPGTLALGVAAGVLIFPELGWLGAAVLAAILAPTDAALGQAVVSSEHVPQRIRQALNVESGLNDGIALPVVLVLAALAAAGHTDAASDRSAGDWLRFAAMQVTLGPVMGVAVGVAGAQLLRRAAGRQWMSETFEQLAGVALAVLAFATAELVGGNGFISAFVAGLALGHLERGHCQRLHRFLEAEGQLLMLLVFLLLGSALAWDALRDASWKTAVYVLTSLTLVRMLPVGLSLLGSGLRPISVLFLGWFGPRGLASLLFGMLVLEREGLPHADEIFAVVIATVLASVLLHGLSAAPAARAYAGHMAANRERCPHEHAPVADHPPRVRHMP